MAERPPWPALILTGAPALDADGATLQAELVAATLDDWSPAAVEDLADQPLPPGGLWDPTCPPPPDPPAAPLRWRVFFHSPAQRDRAAEVIRRTHADLEVVAADVDDEDWAARSQRELTAITAGSFIVAPRWHVPADIAPGTTLIVIEPSRGFGTGHHQSTRLCLRALSDVDVQGRRVLDIGTGSGVLAMAAALGGAHHVTAVDVDPDAIDAAGESARFNAGVEAIAWLVGDFRETGWVDAHGGPWDLVLANLTGGMLTKSADTIRHALAPGGLLIASGFDESERSAVLTALRLRLLREMQEDGWVGVVTAL